MPFNRRVRINGKSGTGMAGVVLLASALVLVACSSGSSSESSSAPVEPSAPVVATSAPSSVAGSSPAAASEAPAIDPAGQPPFQMSTWGGLSAKAFGKAWGGAFEQATGIAYDNSPIMDYAAWQEQVESGNPGWEWGDFEGWFPIAHTDLFADIPLGPTGVGITCDDMVRMKTPEEQARICTNNSIASYFSSYVMAYNPETHADHPSGWAELFDTKKWPGIRSLYNYPYGMLEVALSADGVPWSEMYPLDYERAFKKLDTLGADLVFTNSGAEAQQQMASGSADYIVHWNGRVVPIAQQGIPITIDWKDNILILSNHVIPNNSSRPDVSAAFIKAALTCDAQAQVSNMLGTGPTVEGCYDAIDEDVKPWVPTNPDNLTQAAGLIDDNWWAENFGAAYEKWNAWQASRG